MNFVMFEIKIIKIKKNIFFKSKRLENYFKNLQKRTKQAGGCRIGIKLTGKKQQKLTREM